jgi:hypothetical protein
LSKVALRDGKDAVSFFAGATLLILLAVLFGVGGSPLATHFEVLSGVGGSPSSVSFALHFEVLFTVGGSPSSFHFPIPRPPRLVGINYLNPKIKRELRVAHCGFQSPAHAVLPLK